MNDEITSEIMRLLGKLDADSETLKKAVLGNGSPGLAQRVDSLESSRDRMWGAGAILGSLAGVAEWFFHRK